MRKTILIIGKSLIIISLLYPFPLWFLATWQSWRTTLHMPSETATGYWWWNLLIFVIGLLLCIYGARKYKPLTDSPYKSFFQNITSIVIGAFAIVGVMLSVAIVSKLIALIISIL